MYPCAKHGESVQEAYNESEGTTLARRAPTTNTLRANSQKDSAGHQ